MAQSSSGGGENPTISALRNELILQKIFNFLPLKSLLTCSEVNEFWNARARTYIRDHRKCTVSISSSTILPCIQLEKLDQDLAGMTIIPFNSLKIKIRPHTEPGTGSSRGQRGHHPSSHQENLPRNCKNSKYENVISKFKLKHLGISWIEKVVACPVSFLIFRLLTEKGPELKSLRLEKISSLGVSLFAGQDRLEFPRLDELEIGDVCDWMDDDEMVSLLHKFLNGVPNLSNIIHSGNNRILEILPENKYHLVSNIYLDAFNQDDEDLLELTGKLVESGPRISRLIANCLYGYDDAMDRCHPLFQPLAQACSSYLKTLEISCANAAQKLRMIPLPLPNVTHLFLVFDSDQPFEFVPAFQQIQFQYLFPKLEEVKLDDGGAGITREFPQAQVDREFSNFLPDARHSSLTVKTLRLTMEIRPAGLLQLMKNFPYLEHLEISAGSQTSHALPYSDIFRCWPYLKTVIIGGRIRFEHLLRIQNWEADFCGVYQDELELLRKLEEEDLEKLQIVPIRPCVSTMKDLVTLSLSFVVENYPHDRTQGIDPSSMFLSAVAKMLVLKRMPWLNFRFT